jgi:hypothetical protein
MEEEAGGCGPCRICVAGSRTEEKNNLPAKCEADSSSSPSVLMLFFFPLGKAFSDERNREPFLKMTYGSHVFSVPHILPAFGRPSQRGPRLPPFSKKQNRGFCLHDVWPQNIDPLVRFHLTTSPHAKATALNWRQSREKKSFIDSVLT